MFIFPKAYIDIHIQKLSLVGIFIFDADIFEFMGLMHALAAPTVWRGGSIIACSIMTQDDMRLQAKF